MTKKDVLELKKRFKKDDCTFTKMCGCYVNADKESVLEFDETFLNLEETEMHKYLEITRKVLSGTIGNNLLELNFPIEEEQQGGKHQFLMGIRESKLKNHVLLKTFYQQIIESYDYTGNYLILVFHDVYDVMKKTTDNRKLDESEEVYEYLLCAICPVSLSKPGLGYLAQENRIGARMRDWVVGVPDTGFIFPAFTDRSTDIHSTMFYTKNAKEPHTEFMENGLGCPSKQTATQQKNIFQGIIENAVIDEEQSNHVLMDIQESLTQIIDEQDDATETKDEPVYLTNESIHEILTETGLSDNITNQINTAYQDSFNDALPAVDHLIDSKVLAQSAQWQKEKALVQQVQKLQEKLEETKKETNADLASPESETNNILDTKLDDSFDVQLKINPKKVSQITSQIIGGKKCIIIPMEEHEHATINGETELI